MGPMLVLICNEEYTYKHQAAELAELAAFRSCINCYAESDSCYEVCAGGKRGKK